MTKHQILLLNKAVRELHEKGHSFIGGIHCNSVARLLVEMEQEIKSLNKAAQPKWISVEERLPGEFVDVLLYGDSRGIAIGSYDANDGYFWKREDENTLRSVNATHWMPLPSCPEEE